MNGTSAYSIGVSTSRNKFDALNSMMEEDEVEFKVLKDRMIVDQFLNKKIQPTCIEAKSWSKDMIKYFKGQWEVGRLKEQEDQSMNNEAIFANKDGIAHTMASDDVIGLSKTILN
nr:RNA-directed DNA polymerase, eukaryota, reverse transcriptase zinc-binding domain protein [Tanacetum cinerariifolium]